jgi:hypothetical protein
VASDVLVTPRENGGYSIVIDGIDVSYFTSEYTVSISGTKQPIVTLTIRADRVRMGLPAAIVDAIAGDRDITKEC